jgi:hypothetical protein
MSEEQAASAPTELGYPDLLRLLAGASSMRERLSAGESLRVTTPFRYPGRGGYICFVLTPQLGQDEAQSSLPVRISDGGDLLDRLQRQGMDLAVDEILSKTVFHALSEIERASIAKGQVYIESDLDKLAGDIWMFLQFVVEMMGLRHSKYKEALLRLSRNKDAPDPLGWDRR